MAFDNKLETIDKKYNVERPTYKQEDLEELQTQITSTARLHPEWKEFWIDEPTLIRFLKANITVAESHEALVNFCEWRVKYDVDNISPDDPDIKLEDSLGRAKILYGRTDSCGRPVMVVYPRYHNKDHGNIERLYKYAIYIFEQLSGLADKNGNANGTFCIVFNLQGFGMRNMDYQAVKQMLWILKNCYPERLGVALIYNYPWIFYGFWEVIKHWINSVTRSKILFCGDPELADFIERYLITDSSAVT